MKSTKFVAITACLMMILSVFAWGNTHAAQAAEYVVKSGETLSGIAEKLGITRDALAQANPQVQNPDRIQVGQVLHTPSTQPKQETLTAFEQEVVRLTNAERQKKGLSPLQVDAGLSKVARLKSEDMRDKNYFSHQSPTYGSPFDMMQKFNIQFSQAGENIAAGYPTPEKVVQGWMNSEGHRANILNPDFTHIGVGVAKGGSYGEYETQMFIKK